MSSRGFARQREPTLTSWKELYVLTQELDPKRTFDRGAAFAGGTLARDVVTLTNVGQRSKREIPLINAVLVSNEVQKQWPVCRLEATFPRLDEIRVAVLGLTYKPGTDTLRRSASIELCLRLLSRSCKVSCYDPVVKTLPDSLAAATLHLSLAEAIIGADAIVIMTPWPEIIQADWISLLQTKKDGTAIIDVNHAVSLPEIRCGRCDTFLGNAVRLNAAKCDHHGRQSRTRKSHRASFRARRRQCLALRA